MAKIIGCFLAIFLLCGCSVDATKLAQALSTDKATACASISFAFPPFANSARACRTNSENMTVTVDPNGNIIAQPVSSNNISTVNPQVMQNLLQQYIISHPSVPAVTSPTK